MGTQAHPLSVAYGASSPPPRGEPCAVSYFRFLFVRQHLVLYPFSFAMFVIPTGRMKDMCIKRKKKARERVEGSYVKIVRLAPDREGKGAGGHAFRCYKSGLCPFLIMQRGPGQGLERGGYAYIVVLSHAWVYIPMMERNLRFLHKIYPKGGVRSLHSSNHCPLFVMAHEEGIAIGRDDEHCEKNAPDPARLRKNIITRYSSPPI